MKKRKAKRKNLPPSSTKADINQFSGTEEEALPPERSGLKKLLFGEEKPDVNELEAGSTTVLDILSPTSVDTKSRDYIVVDGVFHAYLYVTGYGYSTTVGNGWLSPLVEAGEGISLNFVLKRQPKDKTLSKIAKTTMINRSRMRDVGDTRQDYEELDSAINSGLYLKDVMNRQGEDFYYMHTLIEVTADDPETLEQRVCAVENLCVSVDMIARRCDYKHEQGFLSALPVLALDPDVERKSKRNALTSGVAASFPFASYELSDRNGIFLGLNMHNRSPVFLDPFDDYKYTNGNFGLFGSSGAGKTFTMQCIGGRLRQQNKRVIFVIPKKGHEFRPLCEQLGGLYLRLSPSSKDCPNIMAIRRKSLDSYASLKNLTARGDSVLAEKISRLTIWYSLQKKDLSDEDRNHIDISLVECYAFTTLIFYSMGTKLFTLRQASRRSWRINQLAPSVKVYLPYYKHTMQHKALKLMASKLAAAGMIEGNFSEEGLSAMSEIQDMTSQMAKELMLGIRDNVEDVASAFKRMAIVNPNRIVPGAASAQDTVPALVLAPKEPVHTESEETHIARIEALLAQQPIPKHNKRKKKVVVDENQLTIFDFVA